MGSYAYSREMGINADARLSPVNVRYGRKEATLDARPTRHKRPSHCLLLVLQ